MNQLVPILADRSPALIAAGGEKTTYRFFELFTANLRNPRTRHGGCPSFEINQQDARQGRIGVGVRDMLAGGLVSVVLAFPYSLSSCTEPASAPFGSSPRMPPPSYP